MTSPAPIPDGYTTVTPWIVSHDTALLLDFVQRAFDAEELARIENPDGSIGHAEPVTEPTTLAFGDRVSRVRDPLGNVYWIQTRLEELSLEEMQRRAALPEYVEAMAYVQSADLPPR
jgi:PhnB protein